MHRAPLLALTALICAAPLHATWSIVAIDTATEEVGVASATCVTGIDLKAFSPVIVVAKGAAAAQSFVDGSGQRRQIIQAGLLAGQSSDEILTQLLALAGTANHQHGIADTGGDSATATGTSNGAHASGVADRDGTVHYAIQGNVLTGSPVVTAAEQAFLATAGALPEKLMAAMEAARSMGGDGRCSCPGGDPTACGSPPPAFTKSSDVGFVLLARFGDTDDAVCDASGCADGDYYLSFNVAFQGSGDPDPVIQLQGLVDTWRTDLIDRPDAVTSSVAFTFLDPDYQLDLELFDWQGTALGGAVAGGVTVAHAADSAGITTIGAVVNNGDGTYTVPLSAGVGVGLDRFLITVDDGMRPVVIPPNAATLVVGAVFIDGFESGGTAAWTTTVP